MKILSKAERYAQAQKKAMDTTKKAAASASKSASPSSIDKIKSQLEKMGYHVNDEKALEELNNKNGTLKLDQISLLHERGAISRKDEEQKQTTQTPVRAPKIFSITEVPEEEPAVQQKNSAPKQQQTTEQKIKDLLSQRKQKTSPTPRQTSSSPTTEKENTNKPEDKIKDPDWAESYPAALQKWCGSNVDKKTGQPKREIKEIRTNRNENGQFENIEIEIKPLSPIARKRGDNGAVYTVKKSPQPDKVNVTLRSAKPGEALNYDYFYALVKAAHDNGADTIEFNNIRTPEFRDKLLVAALQFKMKLKNPPGVINLEAEHLQSIPPGCRQYLEKHNEAVKKVMQERRKEIIPQKGSKFGVGPNAADRTHAEKEAIESEQILDKLKRAEKSRIALEQRIKSVPKEELNNRSKRKSSPVPQRFSKGKER